MKKIFRFAYYILISLLLIISSIIIIFNNLNDKIFDESSIENVMFEGKFKLGDNDWEEYNFQSKLSSYDGDLILIGKFYKVDETGKKLGYCDSDDIISFNLAHIRAEAYYEDNLLWKSNSGDSSLEHETCGTKRIEYNYGVDSNEEITIKLYNDHKFGNGQAYYKFLETMYVFVPNVLYNHLYRQGEPGRIAGDILLVLSFITLISGVITIALKVRKSNYLIICGLIGFFFGFFTKYNSKEIFAWDNNYVFNYIVLSISIILSVFFFMIFIVERLLKNTKKIGYIILFINGITNLILIILSIDENLFLFDLLMYWGIIVIISSIILLVLLFIDLINYNYFEYFLLFASVICLVAIIVDIIGNKLSIWDSGYIAAYSIPFIYLIILVITVRDVLYFYIYNLKLKEIEKELEETRMTVLLSQINPHFLYNSLTSIAELCEIDSQEAQSATLNFASYLRGNMKVLNSNKPIQLEEELIHLENYLELQKIRFGDSLVIDYDILCTDFEIPALTIQPIVENAINHGIRKRESGGIVTISSYEGKNFYFIEVTDNGVGFDVNQKVKDNKEHVGIKNVRKRLDMMCKGKLKIESEIGKGTKVVIQVPKGGI